MAQQVERVLGKDEVTGSNPVSSSKKSDTARCHFFWSLVGFEPVTESVLGFADGKTDEARRVKKTVRWTVFSRSGFKLARRTTTVLFNYFRCLNR